MARNIVHIIRKTLIYYRKAVSFQILIIAILAAVITGSLLTGHSVRKSLRNTSFSRMGNTSILVSSGSRFFDPTLSERLSEKLGEETVSLTELDGFCQNMEEGTASRKIKIYGIDENFFRFNGVETIELKKGEIALNDKLAREINVRTGDDIIIRIKGISDIPKDAPFSTDNDEGISVVLKAGIIIDSKSAGDFSLGISQVTPSNIFINKEDLQNFSQNKKVKPNRLLINSDDIKSVRNKLAESINIADLSLRPRNVAVTGQVELISDRIFIDEYIVNDIKASITGASPVITYLSNSINSRNGQTPYSFITALPEELYGSMPKGNRIIINKWLSEDLGAYVNDSLKLTWFSPDSINELREKSLFFIVEEVVETDSIWGDRTLMPEFPGISGSESCSDWDAGVPVDTKRIRQKDEDYWDNYKGTPKAFVSYETGKQLWGNNYGPATALRFPSDITIEEINSDLAGIFDPEESGFFITNLRKEAEEAASESVDFGTLFLSLGFFIILSAILLLSLSVSAYFDSRKTSIATFYSLGFTKKFIKKLLFSETVIISIIGTFPGIFLGVAVNFLIIRALNSVWQGAVQTNALSPETGIVPVLSGFILTLATIIIFFFFKTGSFLKSLDKKKDGDFSFASGKKNLIGLILSISILTILLFAAFLPANKQAGLSFAAGTMLFITMVLLIRQYFIGGFTSQNPGRITYQGILRQYYKHSPSYAIAPAIFIASGIFALFITSLNRMDFDREVMNVSGGTGGYILWAEATVPVSDNLSSPAGRNNYGLNEGNLMEMSVVQMIRKDGDDASCLNLNHIATPPILGVEPSNFVKKGAFSFSTVIKDYKGNPWDLLYADAGVNTIYGIADQTVLQWGLKIKTGDTLIIKSERGNPLNIIIAAGLKTSVFQGHVLIDAGALKKYYPSVSGSSVFLIEGKPEFTNGYKNALSDRFSNHGMYIETSPERLASFYRVTNTYLSVFTVLGALGMIMGIAGLGFILLRNYNSRKKEFAVMSAVGYTVKKIKMSLLSDLLIILISGMITGTISALIATLPSIQNNNEISLSSLLLMVISMLVTGIAVLLVSVKNVRNESLVIDLRRE